jgi:hypothetical protein
VSARARIAAAQGARWAKVRAKAGKSDKIVPIRSKRTLSASARRKIAACAEGAMGTREGGEEDGSNDPETDQGNPSSQPDWLTYDFYKNQIQPKLINVALAPACVRMHRNTIVPLAPKTHYGSG